jgi:eukaryotic-like serine/threonine-protein kinase
MMDADRWTQIEALCDAALERAPAERGAFLDAECAGDDALRREVEGLLQQLTADPEFLERPLVDLGAAPFDAGEAPAPALIGRYRVLRRLGRGGMGEIFLAEPDGDQSDGTGAERVAIKVIRPGLASGDVLRRFEQERRILANLRHPHIARLLDVAATDDGRPGFVLEYVPGLPITVWADLRARPLRQRLLLFLDVCDAVEHAHRHLVVHRDLKPANILVTESGVVKLLDFGIGKVLESSASSAATPETAASDRLLTLEYASPEQVRGELVTTATDVHALGVLLYELLTGVHPFRHDGATALDIEQAVLDRVPTRPSAVVRVGPSSGPVSRSDARARATARGAASPDALARKLNGDLDNIVLMALRKEPERRYTSASLLADDIRRYLDGMPVRARPDTLGYRARKFVRRNAGSVAVLLLVTLALITTTVVAVLQSERASHASVAVRAERDQAVAVRGFLMEMFGATGLQQPVGASETVRQMLDRQATRIDSAYRGQPLLQARLYEVVADAYDRLGFPAAAVAPARQALGIRQRIQGTEHPDVAASLNLLGWILHEAGQRTEAESLLRRAVALRRRGPAADSAGLAHALNDLGVLLNASSRYAEAQSVLTEALAIRRAGGTDGLAVGITANNLAAAYYYQAQYDRAGATQAIAVAALEAAVGVDHQRTVIALSNLAAFHIAAGDFGHAEAEYRTLLERETRLQGRSHPVTLRIMNALAGVLMARDPGTDRDSALAEAEGLLTAAEAIEDTMGTPGLPLRGVTLDHLAGVRLVRGDTAAALATARRAVTVLTEAHGPDHPDVAAATVRLGVIEADAGHAATGQRLARAGVAGLSKSLGADHPETARGKGRLCQVLVRTHAPGDEPRRVCDDAIAALGKAPGGYRPDLAAAQRARAQLGSQ